MPVAKSGVRVDADERNGFFVLRIKATTPDGREIELGTMSVDVHDGAPVGAPTMTLEATATYRGKDHAVHIYDEVRPGAAGPTPAGKRTSLTALAIEKLENRYQSRFGKPPSELSGVLTKSNKLNYQRAYATLRASNVPPDVAKVQAVREISLGAHRIAAGYSEFSVTLGEAVDIDLGIGWGVHRVPSTTSVTARRPS